MQSEESYAKGGKLAYAKGGKIVYVKVRYQAAEKKLLAQIQRGKPFTYTLGQ